MVVAQMDAPGIKARLRSGDVLAGAWCSIGTPLAAEALALAGADYVVLDQQHGDACPATTADLIPAVGRSAFSIVRVAANHQHLIEKALDQGTDGVIVPVVDTLPQAQSVRDAARFPPEGTRSYGGRTRGVMRSGGDTARANDRIAAIAMVETATAVANIEEICRDSGLDALYIGLNDLAISMGLKPGMTIQPGAHAMAIGHVISTCAKYGVAWGTHASDAAGREELAERGAQLITVCTDISLIDQGAAAALAR